MTDKLSVEQSFQVIKEVIAESRYKFESSGKIFIFWGLVVSIISFGNYYLHIQEVEKAYLINWGYLLAALATFVYFTLRAKKEPKHKNFLGRLSGLVWLIININVFVVAFGFYKFDLPVTFIILLLLSIGYFMSGIIFRSYIAIFGAVLMNISAYIALFLHSSGQLMLLVGFVGVICLIIPGILMEIKRRKNDLQKS